MSLINDALKKAQKQRTGEAPPLASMPGIGGEPPHRIAKRAKPAGFDTLVIRAGIGAGVLLVVVVGGYFAFRSSPAPSSELPAPSSVAQPSASVPAASSPSSPLPAQNPQVSGFRSQVSEPPPAAPAFTLPVAPKPEPASPNVGSPLVGGPSASPVAGIADPGIPASSRTVASNPPSAAAAPAPTGSSLQVSAFRPQGSPPAASDPQVSSPAIGQATAGGFRSQASASSPAKLEPRAIQFIENIKVGAIMARTSTDAKVLMNDRVYRVGSLVEAEMGLTLVGITTGSLTFEDERGGRYTRTF